MDHLGEGIGLPARATRPARRLQARVLRNVRRHDDALPGSHGPPPVPHADPRSRRHAHRVPINSSGPRPRPRQFRLSGNSASSTTNARHCPPRAEHQRPAHQPAPVSDRAPSTTIDALEREFQKKKQRELRQARSVSSSSAASNGNALASPAPVGRNDPTPAAPARNTKMPQRRRIKLTAEFAIAVVSSFAQPQRPSFDRS